MSEGIENVEAPVDANRNLGFEVAKEIFLINSLREPDAVLDSRVLNLEDYQEKQTKLCTAIAVDFSNKEHEKVKVTKVKPLRSNCIIGQTLDKNDPMLYFHVNFDAKPEDENERAIYFAEIKGHDRPEETVVCEKLFDNGAVENCAFCTGIKHPKATKFFGKIGSIVTYKRKRRKVDQPGEKKD